jgi:hypothetical protein
MRRLGRYKHSGEDNIKMYLKVIRWEAMDCINLAHNGGKR